jgi:hypothetical protein
VCHLPARAAGRYKDRVTSTKELHMKKYLVLYLSSVSAKDQMAGSSPEQAQKGMELWMAWMKKAGSAIVDGGAPLSPAGSGNAKLGGYSVLQAESQKALMALLEEHPHRHAPGASIEAYEFQKLPGM